LKTGKLYWRRRRRHHLNSPPNENPKNHGNGAHPRRWGPRSTPPPWPEGHRSEAERRHQQEVVSPNRLEIASREAYVPVRVTFLIYRSQGTFFVSPPLQQKYRPRCIITTMAVMPQGCRSRNGDRDT
jgi:hypothetical protein